MSAQAPEPGAHEAQVDRIVFWHARAHDRLDDYGIPRFDCGMELMLEERIDRLAALDRRVPLSGRSGRQP